MSDDVLLPDGSPFAFWDDQTTYVRTWHVDQAAAPADGGDGSAARPFARINQAAALAGPGERVLVRAGTYRECVRPARGGGGPAAMIHYQAAPGETVVISGAEPWTPAWSAPRKARASGLMVADLPLDRFSDAYNPFLATDLNRQPWFPWTKRPQAEILRALRRRGDLWQDGRRLRQTGSHGEAAEQEGTWYPCDTGERVLVHPFADAADVWEFSAREQCFAPRSLDAPFIRVSGFVFTRAANGIPMPQRGALSAGGNGRWIIEDCVFTDIHAVGLDLGRTGLQPARSEGAPEGGHIVRRCRFADLGVCGACGTGNVAGTLIEDNVLTRIGGIDLEHAYENAGLKFHVARSMLIRRNRIHDLHHACGIWLDWNCGNSRVTGNLIHEVASLLAGIYIEANLDANRVDGNVVWGMRDVAGNDPPKDGFAGGNGISVDMCDHQQVDGNLVGDVTGNVALACILAQGERVVVGRTALGRGHRLEGNLVLAAPLRVHLARPNHTVAAGNLYAATPGPGFVVEEARRLARLDFAGWSGLLGCDATGAELPLEATCDAERRRLHLRLTRPCTARPPAPRLIPAEAWARLLAGESVEVTLEVGPR